MFPYEDHVNKAYTRRGPLPAEHHGKGLQAEPTQDADRTTKRLNMDIVFLLDFPLTILLFVNYGKHGALISSDKQSNEFDITV